MVDIGDFDVQVKDVPAVQVAGLSSVVAVDDDLAAEVAAQFDRVATVLDASGVSRLAPLSRYAALPGNGPGGRGGRRVTTGYVVTGGAVPGLDWIDLPAARVASVVHHGPMDAVRVGRQALARWAEGQNWSEAGIAAAAERTVYLQADGDDQSEWVVELQLELGPRRHDQG